MFTPTLNPNSSSSTNKNPNSIPSLSQHHMELGKILRKHDPTAVRLYDFINHVKVILYNSNEFRWENNSCIEGNLFVYKKQQILNNQIHQSYAFAIINEEHNLIQPISSDMFQQADKLCLFVQITRNDIPQVFSLHFLNENDCLRLHTFINQLLQNIKEQQFRATATSELQSKQINGQPTSADVYRQQTPVQIPISITPQSGSSRQTPNYLNVRQSTPITNDPTLSLKRLLNIPSQNGLDNELGLSPQQNPIDLLPPSAFESISGTPSPPIGAKDNLSQIYQSNQMNREQFRNVLLHLVQNNDQFLDIIHQACLSHRTQ